MSGGVDGGRRSGGGVRLGDLPGAPSVSRPLGVQASVLFKLRFYAGALGVSSCPLNGDEAGFFAFLWVNGLTRDLVGP